MSAVKFPPKNFKSPFATLKGNHVAVRVSDFDIAIKWYVENLDFRIIHEWTYADQKLAYAAPPNDDNFTVEIIGDGNPPPLPKAIYSDLGDSLKLAGYHHFCLSVEDIQKAMIELRKRKVTIIADIFYVPDINRSIAFIADPFGNIIELSQDAT